jgi:hypothetical protein
MNFGKIATITALSGLVALLTTPVYAHLFASL